MEDYGNKWVAEIKDAKTIHELVQKIYQSKREDISDVVWERGPDGTLLFNTKEGAVSFSYFSEHSPIDVIWSVSDGTYSIDTDINMNDLIE